MPTLTCPVCKAQLDQGPHCRRCRADLSLLFDLHEQRQRLVAAAYLAAAGGRGKDVLSLAERAETIKRDAETKRLRALGFLLEHDYPEAWREYNLLATWVVHPLSRSG